MNNELYEKLVRQYETSVTFAQHQTWFDWVDRHLKRLCTEFSFLDIDKPIKFEISGTVRVANFQRFIVTSHFIGLDTGFGNIWYFESKEPTKSELRKYDGHCLVLVE